MSEQRCNAVDDDDDSFHSASDGEHDTGEHDTGEPDTREPDTRESVDDRAPPPVQQHVPAVVLSRPTSLSTDSERSPPPTTQQSSGWDADWDANDEDDEEAVACAAEDLVTPREEPAPAWIERVTLKEETPVVETASGWRWGTALLHAATDGLHTITSTVGEGLSEVIDTVHTAVNIPTPEELARLPYAEKVQLEQKVDDVKESWPASDHDDCDSAMEEESDDAAATHSHEEKQSQLQVRRQRHKCTKRHAVAGDDQQQSPPPPQTSSQFSFGGLFGLQSLVNTSLDVLESVGKRTFDAVTIEETNPSNAGAHQRRRFFLTPEQSTLSDALREQRDNNMTGGERQATTSSSTTPSLQ